MRDRLDGTRQYRSVKESQDLRHLHIVAVSSNRKGEAAWDRLARRECGAFKSTAGEYDFLRVVESNCAEFLPVVYQLVLDNDFMDGEFTLEADIDEYVVQRR